MKIRILSDLHLEFQQWSPPKADADVVVLAGDIDVGIRGVEWARRSFPSSPVVYVPGNHEFYRCHMQDLAARAAYREAGIRDPRKELTQLEVHDCFSITELVTIEDLGLSDPGRAVADVLDGRYDVDGTIPCQTDGGLKCCGHPVGASGLRMVTNIICNCWGAGEAGSWSIHAWAESQPGGVAYNGVAAVSIVGLLR